MTKLIIFDLDGTLAESKQALTSEMAALVGRLLATTRVAVISGGALSQFLKQVVSQLPIDANLANLYILPTSGAALYEYDPSTSLGASWKKIYEERLSEKEAHTIGEAMREAATETGLINFSDQSWGERIEYRGGQVTLSALGQQAPIVLKKAWDPNHTKRHALQKAIAERLPEFSVGIGGITSIDVTKKGIDKAYGIRKLCERLSVSESDALYVGDELEKGGNDEAVYKTSVQTKAVSTPSGTASLIESLIKHMEEPSKLSQKIEGLQNVVSPESNELKEGKIVPEKAKDVFAIFLNIIVGKIKINIFLFKKYQILLLALLILSICSVLYLFFREGSAEVNWLYVLSPIILLIVFYTGLRFWAQYRSVIEVINPTSANMFNALKEYAPNNSVYSILAEIFSLKIQNIFTRIHWAGFLLFVLITAFLFLSYFWN